MTYRVDQETYNATNYVALRATIPNGLLASIVVEGYHSPGDGGGGTFHWDTTSSTGDNGGTIIVPTGSTTGRWSRIYDNAVNVKWWGAYGDGTHDDTAAINNACNFIKTTATRNGNDVFVPSGLYVMNVPAPNSAALFIQHNIHMIGEGGQFYGSGGSYFQIYGYPVSVNVTGASNTNPIIITAPGHLISPGTSGYVVTIAGILGNTAANGSHPTTYINANTFSIPPSGNGTYTSGGTVKYGSGSGISVEQQTGSVGNTSPGTMFSNIGIYANNLAPNGVQDLWVSHAAFTKLINCHGWGASRFGFLNDSGIVISDGYYNGITAPSLANAGTYIFGDQIHLESFETQQCGVGNEVNGNGLASYGGGIFTHGSDGGGGYFLKCNSFLNNSGYNDYSLLGNTFIKCASQASWTGFNVSSASGSVYMDCSSEDINSSILTNGASIFVGGSIINTSTNTNLATILANPGYMPMQSVDGSGNIYGFSAPNSVNMFSTYRIDKSTIPNALPAPYYNGISVWNMVYNLSSSFPYCVGSWRMQHIFNGFQDQDFAAGTPYGFTDIWCPRGPGMLILGNPLINTTRRWSFSQDGYTINPGHNIVYPNNNQFTSVTFAADPSLQIQGVGDGYVVNGSPIVTATGNYTLLPGYTVQFGSQPGTKYIVATVDNLNQFTLTTNYTGTTTISTPISNLYYVHVKTRVSVDIQYNNVTDLASGCTFTGYCFISVGGGRNIAANIYNPTGSPVTASLIWHLESYVQNYDNGTVG